MGDRGRREEVGEWVDEWVSWECASVCGVCTRVVYEMSPCLTSERMASALSLCDVSESMCEVASRKREVHSESERESTSREV